MQVLNFYHLGKVIPEGAVYIGRAMPTMNLKGSKFANPFKITEEQSREIVVNKYKSWLWEQIKASKITLKDLLELEGRDLVCFCAPQACHGDVLLSAVKWARHKYNTVHGHWSWEESV